LDIFWRRRRRCCRRWRRWKPLLFEFVPTDFPSSR
jgi:hypothetical protein